ncbi:MAG: hypothetical protein AAF738_04780 [Bacteroidota bacterium]
MRKSFLLCLFLVLVGTSYAQNVEPEPISDEFQVKGGLSEAALEELEA